MSTDGGACRDRWRLFDRATFGVAAVAAVAATFAACYMRQQWKTMEDTEVRQLRPYIVAPKIEIPTNPISKVDPNTIYVPMKWVNAGNSDTKNLIIKMGCGGYDTFYFDRSHKSYYFGTYLTIGPKVEDSFYACGMAVKDLPILLTDINQFIFGDKRPTKVLSPPTWINRI